MKNIDNNPLLDNISQDKVLELEDLFLREYTKAKKTNSKIKIFTIICKGHYFRFFLAMLFCAIQLSAELFLPIGTANIIDALTSQKEGFMNTIIINLSIALGLLAINYPLQIFYKKNIANVGRYIEAKLRSAIVVKLQQLRLRFTKEMATGRIPSKIMSDVDSVRALVEYIPIKLLHIVINILTVLIVTLIKGNFLILLFYILTAPVILLLFKRQKKNIRNSSSLLRKTRETASANVVEMAELIPVTKAHALEELEIEKLSNTISKTASAGFNHDMTIAKFVASTWIFMKLLSLFCLILLIFFALNGTISIGEIVLYNSYFATMIGTISSIMDIAPHVANGGEALLSLGEILDCDDIEENEGKPVIKDVKGEFVFKDVHFAYQDEIERDVLQGLDLTVKAGETIALVGESGSGKSTIINLVCGFEQITDGLFTIDGYDADKINLHEYRKNIAVVLQNSILFSGSVRDNITYGIPNVSEKKLNEILHLACLEDVVKALPEGLDSRIGEHGNKLSGGQRQRISIARALIRNPKIIIFDEATSALDTVSEKHIQTAIENLSKDKTTFIVAHRLSTVKNADKIAVIENGRCVEFGTYDELVTKKGAFYKFRQLQI